MTNNKSQLGWGFWSLWVILIAVFFAIGWILGFASSYFTGDIIESCAILNNYVNEALTDAIEYCIMGAIIGASVGLIQWIILKRKVSLSASWILASIAGLAASELVAGLVFWAFGSSRNIGVGSLGPVLIWILIYTVGGALIGLLQWPVLRRKVKRAGWWVLASALGWGLTPVFWGLMAIRGKMWGFSLVGGSMFISGLVLGTVTGVVLNWLLRNGMEKT